ncbi:SusC/RagA family TonB-linked outer membrane protein [Odoribacter sp. AF15-53]|uniref:SusC/RagA family TonB-linked outer membrane protein n=1 Tax=Odoribacter sp. AF15-53 TaxID=2292236 RepID=UPI000E47ABA2|nr:SusC/RagA family TonB-linked outer membrane protein [Odoribacter sp. AF15-53]RHR80557.1 SusC/RagA family TonB-linked outer membrane protein [Odoribacter sp. AF15-53]
MMKKVVVQLRRILTVFVMLVLAYGTILREEVSAQSKQLSVKFEHVSLLEALSYLSKQTGGKILYNHERINKSLKISVVMNDKSLPEILDRCLQGTGYMYKEVDGVYIISEKKEEVVPDKKERIVTGSVKDENGEPLPGATIILKGTRIGMTTNEQGNFTLVLPERDTVILLISFIGYETREVTVKGDEKINVKLKVMSSDLEGVVVTGYGNIDKKSFTGNAISVSKEELLKVSKTNVMQALQVFDPSFRIRENNKWGSDPNALPEVNIRGTSSTGVKALDADPLDKSNLKNNSNLPTFIMDGFEISAEKLYDFDPNRIQNITILKDAAATAIYGSRAANGVVVITTVAPKAGQLSVTYSLTGSVSTPDLSGYNLMNARELLDTEIAAGFYEAKTFAELYSKREELLAKEANITKGVNTYWLSQPLRTEFNTQHSLYVQGGAQGIRYGIDFSYRNDGGVMKESFRKRIAGGFSVNYQVKGISISNTISYNVMKSEDSPYGAFSDYALALPYDQYKNDDGVIASSLPSWHSSSGVTNEDLGRRNPLYESTLNNFSGSKYEELIDNFGVNWTFAEHFLLKGQFSVTRRFSTTERFIDPKSLQNDASEMLSTGNMSSGSYNLGKSEDLKWNTNIFLAYNQLINNHNINLTAGMNMLGNKTESFSSEYRGFPSGKLNSINYAEKIYEKPKVTEQLNRMIGFFAGLNYTYNNIYLLDASCRFDGSSDFGKDKKFAPFWSAGVGINIHNYGFMKNQAVLSTLKLRASYGATGKVNFPPYVAKTTYEILTDEWYRTGFGASMKALGNSDLTWEKTQTIDVGFQLGLMSDRLFVTGSWYHKKTTDLITTVSVPTSSGFDTYHDNMGNVLNKGVELDVKYDVIRTRDWGLSVYGNLAHNRNEILAISDALKRYNDRVNNYYLQKGTGKRSATEIFTKYEEGGSNTALYGMKSLGIDPANGKEMFLKKDGTVTYTWSGDENVIIGDTEADAQGSFGFNLRYKNWTMFASFMYKFGGDVYNQTLATKVEGAKIYDENVDKRVMKERWQKPGDIAKYKDIKNQDGYTRPTSRFMQKDNELSLNSITLGYDMESAFLKRYKFGMIRFELGANDVFRISPVKRERGTSYPYAHSFNFTVKINFN